MSRVLAGQRCLHHAAREAVARCPECRQFYCRECITEHDDRVICSACLKRLVGSPAKTRKGLPLALWPIQVGSGLLVAWFFFYSLGRLLVQLPASFHDGTEWIENQETEQQP